MIVNRYSVRKRNGRWWVFDDRGFPFFASPGWALAFDWANTLARGARRREVGAR